MGGELIHRRTIAKEKNGGPRVERVREADHAPGWAYYRRLGALKMWHANRSSWTKCGGRFARWFQGWADRGEEDGDSISRPDELEKMYRAAVCIMKSLNNLRAGSKTRKK